jgi:hypothetical protein
MRGRQSESHHVSRNACGRGTDIERGIYKGGCVGFVPHHCIVNLLGALKRGLCNCQSTRVPGPMPPIVANAGGPVYSVVRPPPNCTKTCESNRLPSSPAIESARCFRNL